MKSLNLTTESIISKTKEAGTDKYAVRILAPTGFEDYPDNYQQQVLSRALYGHPNMPVSNYKIVGYNQNDMVMVDIVIPVGMEDFIKLATLEESHKEILNGAIEITDPITIYELEGLAEAGHNTFMTTYSPFLPIETVEAKKEYFSTKIIGSPFLSKLDFEFEQWKIESPIKGDNYVRFTIKNLDFFLPSIRREGFRLERIWSEVQSDYPKATILGTPFNINSLNELIKAIDNPELEELRFEHLIEVSLEDLNVQEGYSMEQVIKNHIYLGQSTDFIQVEFRPAGVNPIKGSTIFYVSGCFYLPCYKA